MKKIFKFLFFLVVLGCAAIYLEFSGYFYHNDIFAKLYKIQGIDISHHQEKINWKKVSKKYKFVIMKRIIFSRCSAAEMHKLIII